MIRKNVFHPHRCNRGEWDAFFLKYYVNITEKYPIPHKFSFPTCPFLENII